MKQGTPDEVQVRSFVQVRALIGRHSHDTAQPGQRVATDGAGIRYRGNQPAAITSISTSQSLTSVSATMAVVGMARPPSALTLASAFASA
jgi:hypothetical protein